MHGNRGLSTTRYPLYDDAVPGAVPDNFILFLLYGGDNLAEYYLFVLTEILRKNSSFATTSES